MGDPGSLARDRDVVGRLEDWFRRAQRDLPWRRRRTGYTALVSEAMLQQTQVARIVDRYPAFMRRFPSLRALARANEQDVLAAWQGLGYYRRARSLHAAARFVVEERGGRIPRSAEALRELPGVGRYTAGAIASIVHDEPVPIVDGNVRRVLLRLDARDEADPGDGRTWRRAGALVALADRPSAFNEGLMELGATVCTPRAPRCSACPIAPHCRARARGRQEAIPAPRRSAPRTTVHHHAVVLVRGGRVLLEQRGGGGLWAGLWQPPTVEAPRLLSAAEVAASLEIPVTDLRATRSFDHLTTHRRVRFHVFSGSTRVRRGRWVDPAGAGAPPLSSAHRKVLGRA